MSRTVAVIQARMGSTRLPGKVLADVVGAPLLARMIERVRAARSIDAIVVATSDLDEDAPVRALAEELGVGCFAGSAHDVLSRMAGAARRFDADPLVRLTADCPLIDPHLIDRCVTFFHGSPGCDHAGLAGAFPDGLDTEVVAARALFHADAAAALPSEREHVTPYILNRPDAFSCLRVPFPVPLGDLRWTVDESRDLEFVREVYRRLYRPGEVFGWLDVAALLAREPELVQINGGIERNAGYRRSREQDALLEAAR